MFYNFLVMVKATLYTKDYCWLCEQMESLLMGYADEFGLELSRVEISEGNEELYEKYRFIVPVLEFKDGFRLQGRVKKEDLRRALGEHQE